jgi:general secretion pathway protein H
MTRRPARGFSLIELLVVVIIVAMVTSIAMLSIGIIDDDRELDTEARRLASLMNAIQEEAAMQGRDFGMELMTGSYRFVEYDAFSSQWIEVVDDELLRLRELPEDVEFDLYLEGQRVVLSPDPAEIEDPEDEDKDAFTRQSNTYAPHIFLFSSGDVTPFQLTLTRLSTRASLPMEGDYLGTITIGEDED